MSFAFLKPSLAAGRYARWTCAPVQHEERTCSKCQRTQPAAEFYRIPGWCRTCTKAGVNAWRRAKRG